MLLKSIFVMCAFWHCDVSGQICRKRTVVTKLVYEDYHYSYEERFSKKNWYGRTVYKTRMKTALGSRPVQKQEVDFVPSCCDGYIRTDSGSLDDIECTPICTPACENGKCISPGECECNAGYSLAVGSPHKCSPTCEMCVHGTCVAPNVCRCDYGYAIQNGTACLPICTEPCINSVCIAPDTCQCLYGYRKTDGNICSPYCSQGCLHGICTEPETCICNTGWQKKESECVPKCDKQCGNGSCIEPNHCKCNEGYKVNEEKDFVCVPYCNVTCGHGSCVAPDICKCDEGYRVDTSKEPVCVPQCENECGNGSCVAPNICICNTGYKMDRDRNPVCIPQCDVECGNGSCVAPNTCVCDAGYELHGENNPVCLPKCDISCGNGSCIAPNVCKCFPGYKMDKDKCIIDCGQCEGICNNEGKCECNEPFKAVHVTADGGECKNNIDTCTRVICKLDVITTTEGVSYGFDDLDTDATIELRPTTSNVDSSEPEGDWYDYNEEVLINGTAVLNSDVENQIQGSEHWMQSKWQYAVISIVVIILAIVLGSIVIFWSSIINCCKGGGDYTVGDTNIEGAEKPERFSDGTIRMSTILQKRKEEE